MSAPICILCYGSGETLCAKTEHQNAEFEFCPCRFCFGTGLMKHLIVRGGPNPMSLEAAVQAVIEFDEKRKPNEPIEEGSSTRG